MRLEKREQKANAEPRAPGEDPDLAGMVAGPQPRDPFLFGLPEDEADDAAAESDEDNPRSA